MAPGYLFVLGSLLLLLGQKTLSQTCPIFGKDGQGLSGSLSNFKSDRRIFLNFDAPAQCNGTVTSWQYCFYYENDDDDGGIGDDSNSQQYGAYILVYRRMGSSDNYQPVANSTRLVSVIKSDVSFNSVRCFTVTLAASDQFQIETNDIVAACISDTSTYRELRIVRRNSGQDSYQYNMRNYEDCTTQQLQTVDTGDSDFRIRSGYGLLLYANISTPITTQCSAGSNPPPFSASTTSGTYLNTAQPVQCTDTITAWHYCYYPSSATNTQTTYTAVIGVWRMNTDYELVTGSSFTLQLQPETTFAKVICKSVYLQEAEYVRVNQSDVIGVTIPTQNSIPMVASEASGYSLQRSSDGNQPGSLASSQLTTMSNMALHLYADIEFVPTTPPPTTVGTIEATTAATTTQSTTLPSTTQSTTTEVGTTNSATTPSSTTKDEPPPATTQGSPAEATSTMGVDLSTTSEATTLETTVGGSNIPNGQDSRLSIGTLVGVVSATIVTALIIVFVSVVIVYKWQLWRCTPDKQRTEKGGRTGIQNVLYDAVGEEVTIGGGGPSSYMTLGTIYEEINEPYNLPQKPSPTRNERKKPVTIFTQSGNGYYAAVGPGAVEYTVPFSDHEEEKEVKVKNESPYYSPASEETALYEQIRMQGIKLIKKENIQVTGELGTGQFGNVDKGIMKPDNVEVAIKSLKSNASSMDRIKFLQEAAIMAQFNHPNVVKLYGVVRDRATVWIVLDLLNKGDLVNHLSTLKPDPGQLVPSAMPKTLLSFSQQVALGMVYLAGKGFVHRDLAARNILVSEQNICKIADFGMSRDLAQSDYYVSQGGKVPIKWTAPEAIYFMKYSTASDVWSYGCLLYEIWSLGYKPFKGLRNIEAMRLVDSGKRLTPPPGCPKVVYEIMMQCWNPEASNRPGFRDVLLALLENEDMVLDIPVEDCSSHTQASVLGAPIDAGMNMYRDMQSIYNMEVTAM